MSDPPLRDRLAARGYAVVRGCDDLREAGASPWSFAERLLGARPVMVEQQPIRAVPGGRSFASTQGFTPLHSDSQLHLGAPPDAQVMVCHRHAAAGGETLLLDTWSLLEELQRAEPALHRALFEVPRRIPFVFGDVYGPTVSLRGGATCFTHSPIAPAPDALSQALAARLRAHPTVELAVHTGEVLVVDNRRMLHGRKGFDDTARWFTRLLVWLPAPLGAHPGCTAMARAAAARAPSRDDAPPSVRSARYGVLEAPAAGVQARLDVVLRCSGAWRRACWRSAAGCPGGAVPVARRGPAGRRRRWPTRAPTMSRPDCEARLGRR
ncbi:MAG: TauD/TfdA family dioxygenase [Polyangiales bacterium]